MNPLTIPNSVWIERWQRDNCGYGIKAEKPSPWRFAEIPYMGWFVCLASTRHLKNGSMVMRRRAFMLSRNNCVTLDIAASSTLI